MTDNIELREGSEGNRNIPMEQKGSMTSNERPVETIRVLILEDDPMYVMLLNQSFSRQKDPGFVVESLPSVSGCVASLNQTSPDVVLMDLNVADSKGMDTFLKIHDKAPHLPIVIISSVDDAGMAIEAVRRGAQDYLVKGEVSHHTLTRVIFHAIERKRSERALQEAEARYRTVFESSAAAIMMADAEERVVSWNRFCENLLGMGHDDLYLRPLHSFYSQEEWQKIRSQNIRQKGMQHHLETKMLNKDGLEIDVDISISVLKDVDGKVTGSIGIIRDITDRKLAEQKIRTAEQKYRTIFDFSAVAIMVTDAEEQVISWNRFAENLLGMGPGDLYRKPVQSFYSEAEWQRMRSANIRQKGMQHHFETRMLHKDGREIEVDISISVLKDADGRVTGSIGIIRDITDRRQVERLLKKRQEDLDEHIKELNCLYAVSKIFADPETPLEEFFGDLAHVIRMGCKYPESVCVRIVFEEKEFPTDDFRETPWCRHADLKLWGRSVGGIDICYLEKRTAGEEDPFTENEKSLIEAVGEHLGKIIENKRAGEALKESYDKLEKTTQVLVQTEKLSAIGILAAGVAHELNNPLMGVVNFVEYCKKHTQADDKRFPVLEDAERETKRCIEIVKNLLTFARAEDQRSKKWEMEGCDVIFDRVLRLLHHRIQKDGVAVRTQYAENLPKTWVVPGELQQVFLNLTVNALDALKEVEKKEIYVDIKQEKGGMLRVSVTDTGTGISKEILPKIFNPFYTTKPTGQGTGLGLSISQSIVESHGGSIQCESETGKGTTLTVILPSKPDGR